MRETTIEQDIHVLRKRRARRAAATLGSGYFNRAVSILVALVQLPLTLSYLGAERFGLWAILFSIYIYLTATDFGLGYGITNRVAQMIGRDNREEGRRIASTAILLSLLIGLALGVLLVVLVLLCPIAHWFHIQRPGTGAEFKQALLVLCVIVAMVLPINTMNRIQDGHQRAYQRNLWMAWSGFLTIGLILLCIRLHLPLAFLVISVFVPPLLLNACSLAIFLKKNVDVRFFPHEVSRATAYDLLHVGKWFFLMNSEAMLISNCDVFLIGLILTPAAVAPFFFVNRIMSVPLGLLVSVPGSLWPAFAEALAANDAGWVKTVFTRITSIGASITAFSATMLLMWGNGLLHIWVGDKVKAPLPLLAGMAVYMIISYWNTCSGVLVGANDGARTLTAGAFVELTIKIALAYLILHKFGVGAVGLICAAAALGSGVVITTRVAPLLRPDFKHQAWQRLKEVLITVAIVLLVSAPVHWLLTSLGHTSKWNMTGGICAAGTLSLLLSAAQNTALRQYGLALCRWPGLWMNRAVGDARVSR